MVVRRLPTKYSIRTIQIIECSRLSDVITMTITDNYYVLSLFNKLVIYYPYGPRTEKTLQLILIHYIVYFIPCHSRPS